MKNIYRILAFSLAVLLLMMPLSACGVRRRPLHYLKSAITRTLSRSSAGEILSLFEDALAKGSLSFSFEGGDDASIGAGSAALYFNKEDGRLMADTALTLRGERYDVGAWLSEGELALTSTAFLGSTTLGVNLATLEQDLKNSIFRSNSGTTFANPRVDDRTDDAVMALVNGFFTLYRSTEALKPLLDERIDGFLKSLTEHAEYSRYTENGQVYIYLEVDNSMLSRALRDAWGEAVQDKAFVAKLRELAATRDAMSSALSGVTVDDYAARVERWIVSDAEIEALCAEIDNATPFTLTLSAAVRRLTARVTVFDLTYTAGDISRGFLIDLSEKDGATLTLTRDGAADKLVWKTEKEGPRIYRATFAYSRTDGLQRDGSFEVNRRKNEYTLSLTGEKARTVKGNISLDRKGFSLSVDSMALGEERIDFTCALAVRPKADPPDMPSYVSLPTITEPRFTPVYNRASEARTRFAAALAESGVTPDARGILAYLLSLAQIDL